MNHATKAPTKRAQSNSLRGRHLLYFDHDGSQHSIPIDSDALVFTLRQLIDAIPCSDFRITADELKSIIKACEQRLGGEG